MNEAQMIHVIFSDVSLKFEGTEFAKVEMAQFSQSLGTLLPLLFFCATELVDQVVPGFFG